LCIHHLQTPDVCVPVFCHGYDLDSPLLLLCFAALPLLHMLFCSEGIVHADLKAANVMLTSGGDNANGTWCAAVGGRRMTAKVADFGLALPLDPSDTHATLSARVGNVLQTMPWCTCSLCFRAAATASYCAACM
jgi:serine/threonine protein kinase